MTVIFTMANSFDTVRTEFTCGKINDVAFDE